MNSRLKRPIVAAYVSNRVFNNLIKQKDKKYYNIRALVKANEIAQTTLYFFSYGSVDFTNQLITGISFDEIQKAWVLRYFPFPDVFHDRTNMTTRIQMVHLDLIRKKFDELQIKKINSRHFFDKWDLYLLLSNNPRLRSHLPLTRRFTINDLDEMLQRSNKIYVKGRTGRRGMEVMAIKRRPGSVFEYNFHRNQVVSRQVQGLDNLMKVIDSFFSQKNLIIQQAINLLCMDEQIADLRGEVQRNGSGELEITAIAFRVGQRNSPVTTRGSSYDFEIFCEESLNFGEEKITVFKSQIEYFLTAIYKCVEDHYGPFGEIGIDLGLDKHGKIWFIECNAKSGKVSLCNTSDEERIIRAFLNPLEYAKYLYMKNN